MKQGLETVTIVHHQCNNSHLKDKKHRFANRLKINEPRQAFCIYVVL